MRGAGTKEAPEVILPHPPWKPPRYRSSMGKHRKCPECNDTLEEIDINMEDDEDPEVMYYCNTCMAEVEFDTEDDY